MTSTIAAYFQPKWPSSKSMPIVREKNHLPDSMNQINFYKNEAQEIYHKMTGKWDPIDVKVCPSISYAATIVPKKTIYLHPLILLKPEDFPDHLRIYGPDDLRLKSDRYIQKLRTWLAKTFKLDPKKLHNLQEYLDMQIRTWQKPYLLDRIKRFAIAHEVGHIFHQHQNGGWDTFFSFFLSVLLTVLLIDVLPFYLVLSLSIIISDICHRTLKAIRQYSEQYQEKEADIAALRVTKDLQAAKALFKALDANYQRQQHQWKKESWLEKTLRMLFHTESFFHISHPSPKTRIQYLQNEELRI